MDPVRPAAKSRDPYANPELFDWLDSMEGATDVLGPGETEAERERWSGWQHRGNRLFALAGTILPGLVLAALIALLGRVLSEVPSDVLGLTKTPLSPILIAILVGLLIRNSVGLPSVYEAGLSLALTRVLRIGVALLGIRLSLASAGSVGLVALPIVMGCIVTGLLLVTRLGRMVGLPPRLTTLIAVGTAICGNSAIVAMAPTIEATDDEVSYAVGCITLFGLVALMLHPYLAHAAFGGDAMMAGLFLGTAIHDTAQVAGAGLIYVAQFGASEALDVATITKLQRNMFMLAVIPAMAFVTQRRSPNISLAAQMRGAIPFFVLGFLVMSLVRTVGDLGDLAFGFIDRSTWDALIATTARVATGCLTVAMAAVGLGTSFSRLKGLGLRPLAVGLAAATVVGLTSYGLIHVFAPLARG